MKLILFQPSLLVSYTVIGIFIGLVVGKIKRGKPKNAVVNSNDLINPNEPSISEASIAGFLVNQVGGENNPTSHYLSFPAVSPTEVVNVRIYHDNEESLATYKTFDFDYTNKTNPLLEKELFQLVYPNSLSA